MQSIDTRELHARHLDETGTILDVRGPDEFAQGHVQGALNVPHDQVDGRLAEIPKDRPVLVHCAMGGRAQRAAAVLEAAGYEVICVTNGGMREWAELGFPTVR
ncbi:MAG: rhodanese-like domain-containing protein [Sandaracinaceae bacterium]|nr:rhodanese-like domain-containing protein [Sandaracinaceae bacterium]